MKNELKSALVSTLLLAVTLLACKRAPTVETIKREKATEVAAAVKEEAPQELPVIDVTAKELSAAYDANEVSADASFKGRKLKVSGTVMGIDKDFTDNIIVKLGPTSNMFMSVFAYGMTPSRAGSLSKGQKLTLTCVGDGKMIGSPILRECL